jgi:hypothetical protein
MYILGGMYFYVTMLYIVPYIDFTVFSVTYYSFYVRTTATTYTMYMTITSLLLSSIMSTLIFTIMFSHAVTISCYLFHIFNTLSLLLSYILYSITTIVTSSQMTTFQKEQRKIWELYSQEIV